MARQAFDPLAEYEIKPGALPFEAVAGNIPAEVKAVEDGVIRAELGMAAADMDDQLDAILVQATAAAGASGGTGARTVAITVNDGTAALESARVRMTKGAESYLLSTNASGLATFSLDDGTWAVVITLAGYTFTPATLVVAANVTQTYSMTEAGFTPSVEPDSVTVRWRVKGKDRATVGAGEATVYVAVQDGPGRAGEIWSGNTDSESTNANGYVEFTEVPIPCVLLVRAGANGIPREVVIPATATSPYDAGELTNQDVD
jgi:hypothetical protein